MPAKQKQAQSWPFKRICKICLNHKPQKPAPWIQMHPQHSQGSLMEQRGWLVCRLVFVPKFTAPAVVARSTVQFPIVSQQPFLQPMQWGNQNAGHLLLAGASWHLFVEVPTD